MTILAINIEYFIIVTAYYKIKSKFPHEKYHQWMPNFLSLKVKIISQGSKGMRQLSIN